ncbi:hypothetical protein GCM10011583_55070 [Streptomyces camponoticapitis]|uniref:Uncharacterized protein n=1 Tax=Streptomyces camponoticapitis TaxID=1616125 RepID=A0ABQ2ELM7_9ACTN|nr:hypothetical protein [Streptomyces camponoticapitis]GGK16173.1 hypothetical protein GCM10011583_55070 [Streptomyces camponoticapitis]
MQQIGPRVGMRLIHITHSEHTSSATYHHYRIQTAWVDRPPEGARLGYLRCASCGDMVGFRLQSESRAKARQRWLLATALIAPAVVAMLIVLTVTIGEEGNRPLTVLSASLISFVMILSIGALLGEDGVTLARRNSGVHHFQPLNPRLARSKPHESDWPVRAEIVFPDSDPLDYASDPFAP